jgi:hypothetical protein
MKRIVNCAVERKTMKVTMESTDQKVILNGLELRVWEGVSAAGTPFVVLVNRMIATNPDVASAFIAETVAVHKKPATTTPAALERLGLGGVPADYGGVPEKQ